MFILFPDFSVQDTGNVHSQQAAQLKPQQEVRGHPLGPASLVLSPSHLWLASVGRDGLLRIRETTSMVGVHFIQFYLLLFKHLNCFYCVLWCCCCTYRIGTLSCNVIHTVMEELRVCHSLQTARHLSLLALMMALFFVLISGKQMADLRNTLLWTAEGTVALSSGITPLQCDGAYNKKKFH